VSWPTKQAVVTYDASRVTEAQMLGAVKQVGFAARRHP
jgi:copper chaperone CopZ